MNPYYVCMYEWTLLSRKYIQNFKTLSKITLGYFFRQAFSFKYCWYPSVYYMSRALHTKSYSLWETFAFRISLDNLGYHPHSKIICNTYASSPSQWRTHCGDSTKLTQTKYPWWTFLWDGVYLGSVLNLFVPIGHNPPEADFVMSRTCRA